MNQFDDSALAVDLNEATQLVKENRFDAALKLLDIILSNNADHIDALYLAAVSSRYLKKFDESKNYIEGLLKVAPDMARAYQELGHLNKALSNDEKAISSYRQACELNPALYASWAALHEYFSKQNNISAKLHAEEQIDKLKSLPKTLLYIDQIMNEGRLGIAEKRCREFLKVHPTNTYAMSQLAEIADRLGYFDDAEVLLEKAVEFNPEDGDLRMKYAMVLRKKQKFEKTMEQVNILCQKFPNNISYQTQKASELMQNGDHEKAVDLFDHIITKNPVNFSSYTFKGHALKTLGKTDDAIDSYKSAYNIKSDHGEAFFSLSNLKTYSFTDNEINIIEKQLSRIDLSLKEKVYFHFALAQACESKGDYDKSFHHLAEGNLIKRNQSKYSIEMMDKELNAQIEVCDKDFFNNLGLGGHESKDPIFYSRTSKSWFYINRANTSLTFNDRWDS